MALEAVVFSQDPFFYSCKDLYMLGGLDGSWSYEQEDQYNTLLGIDLDNSTELGVHANWDSPFKEWDPNSSSPEIPPAEPTPPIGLRKRRRTKSFKNKEEVENQRMTHIAVERNRRKMMNDYLGSLRSLMPPSYVQRGDQASIIGGAINYVKELEQLLKSLQVQKRKQQPENNGLENPFAEFLSFPQYSTCYKNSVATSDSMVETNPSAADIEVTVVDSHANIKIVSERRPKQLLKMVAGFHSLRLSILHLNVTSMDQMVLYSLSVKVEDDCQLSSVEEIAAMVNQMLLRIQEEASDLC